MATIESRYGRFISHIRNNGEVDLFRITKLGISFRTFQSPRKALATLRSERSISRDMQRGLELGAVAIGLASALDMGKALKDKKILDMGRGVLGVVVSAELRALSAVMSRQNDIADISHEVVESDHESNRAA